MRNSSENVSLHSQVMRFDQKIMHWIVNHRIKTFFLLAFIGGTWYGGFYPWIFAKLAWKEKISKKLRRWILGEQNLPPPSITECSYKVLPFDKTKLAPLNQTRLEYSFEKWDHTLNYGVSYKLLELILSDMKLLVDEKEKEAFVRETGYFREVNISHQANQYCCSVTLQEFFDIVSRFYKKRTDAVTGTDETAFVDEFIHAGNNRLQEVKLWEPQHQVLRREHGKEISASKEDKTQEIITLLSKDPEMSLENIESHLQTYGMGLGIVDKIHILMSQRDNLTIKIEDLMSKSKE